MTAKPGPGWSPRNFRFDELDCDSACIPYGPAEVELPAGCRGQAIRVEGRLIGPDAAYKARWEPPAQVLAFERNWQRFCQAAGIAQWKARMEQRLAKWPHIAAPPTLKVWLDGAPLLHHTPAQEGVFFAECALPPRTDSRGAFRLVFQLKSVMRAEILAGLATLLLAVPMPLVLWKRMRDWQFRTLHHRRLRLLTVSVDGEVVVDFRNRSTTPGPAAKKMFRPGLNIVGHFLSESSMGEAARGSVRAADAAGIPNRLVRLRIPLPFRQEDDSLKARLSPTLAYPMSLYHIYMPETEEIEMHHGTGWMSGRYNIAFWAWETNEFPDIWVRHARRFNEIWAPSRFAAEAIQRRVPVPVLPMPHVIDLPTPTGGNLRAKFGLPEHLFLFLFVFDLNSLTARKNPEAVVEAFRRVAARNPATGLVLKTHNVSRNAADAQRLREQITGLSNVFLLDRTLTRSEVCELMACCDTFVSLHRAEGFGLCVAEAMFLGKPVVSTDWSATAEYVTPQNGFPVRYRLTRLERHIAEYVRGTEWAEPDVEHAAACMEQLASNPRLCAALGAQAARDVQDRFSAATVGRLYAQRLESILSW